MDRRKTQYSTQGEYSSRTTFRRLISGQPTMNGSSLSSSLSSPSPPAYVPPHRRHGGSSSSGGRRDGDSGSGTGSGSSNCRWTTTSVSQNDARARRKAVPWNDDNGSSAVEKQRRPKQKSQSQQSHHPAVTTAVTTSTTTMTTTTITNTTVLLQAFRRIYCINLKRRPDRWNTFCQRLLQSLQEVNNHNNNDGGVDSSRRRRRRRECQLFRDHIQRFDAVDGATVLAAAASAAPAATKTDEETTHRDNGDDVHHLQLSNCCLMEWDATQNAKWDRHIQPPFANKRLTPGEVGCAMSHVTLWKKALEELQDDDDDNDDDEDDDDDGEHKQGEKDDDDDGGMRRQQQQQQQPNAMLILEDDAVLYRGRKSVNRNDQRRGTRYHDHGRQNRGGDRNSSNSHHHHHQHDDDDDDNFAAAFAKVWTAASRSDENLLATPPNYAGGPWDILYFGFSDRGERTVVYRSSTDPYPQQQQDGDVGPDICLFRPTYGFHTHAYAITHKAAARLLDNLPVVGPLDVWLADHDWFGLNILVGCIEKNTNHDNNTRHKYSNNRASINLITQRRHDTASDIAQSGRTNENESIL